MAGAGALGVSPANATPSWQTKVGAETPDHGIQALAFLPNDLTVNVNDSITWNFQTPEIHTLTLLHGAPVPPDFSTACVTVNGVTDLGPGTYAKVGGGTCPYIDSGVMAIGQSYTVNFGAPGSFSFICLVHPDMTGTVHVQPAGVRPPHNQAYYDEKGSDQSFVLLSHGLLNEAIQSHNVAQKPDNITIGKGFFMQTSGGLQSVLIARFLPSNQQVHVGDTVTWTALDPATPHTVTLGDEPGNPFARLDESSFSCAVGGKVTLSAPYPVLRSGTPTVNSGFLGLGGPCGSPTPPDFSGTSFAVKFTAAGTYQFYCALHDDLGMVGQITVLP